MDEEKHDNARRSWDLDSESLIRFVRGDDRLALDAVSLSFVRRRQLPATVQCYLLFSGCQQAVRDSSTEFTAHP